MKFTHSIKTEAEINLTPLIDVVFLLLIFFMVSTTFIGESHLSIDLPEAKSEDINIVREQIEVSITRQGDFAVNGTALIDTSLESLKDALQKAGNGDNSMPLIIIADAATPHQLVVMAMDAAGQTGFAHLSIATKHGAEE